LDDYNIGLYHYILVEELDEKIKIYFSGITEKNNAILDMINNEFSVLDFGTEMFVGNPF
jgi:hypothetical protein